MCCFCLAFLFVKKVPAENNNYYEVTVEAIEEEPAAGSVVVSDITVLNPVVLKSDVKQDSGEEKEKYKWFYTDIYIEPFDILKEHVLVMEYENLSSAVIEALLYTGNLEQSISKDSLSEDGKLVFPLTMGNEGTYYIVLYGTGDIGGCHTYVLPKEEYVNLQKSNEEFPRDRMRDDAMID